MAEKRIQFGQEINENGQGDTAMDYSEDEDRGDKVTEADQNQVKLFEKYEKPYPIEKDLKNLFRIMIPSEASALVFDRLDICSRLEARKACKLFRDLVDPTLSWSPWLFDPSAQDVMDLASRGHPFETLHISKLQAFEYPKEGMGFSKVSKIQFHPFQDSLDGSLVGISNENLKHVLNECEDIEGLKLHSGAFDDISIPSPFRDVELKELNRLEMSSYNADGHGFFVCADIFHNTFQKLSDICIVLLNRDDLLLHHPLQYKEVFQFIIRHSKTLKAVELSFNNAADEGIDHPFVLLTLDHSIPVSEFEAIMQGVSNISLTDLYFHPTCNEGNARFQFGIQLLKAQKNLCTLELQNISMRNVEVWRTVPGLLAGCASTLKKVKIAGCFCVHNNGGDEIFSGSLVKNCYNLEVFQIEICDLQVTDIDDLPKQIQVLGLGPMLIREQIEYICNNFLSLKELTLTQAGSKIHVTIPKVIVPIFKQVLNMPNLTLLVINKRYSSWKPILKIISSTRGLQLEHVNEEKPNPAIVKIRIDRSVLNIDSV